MLGPEENVCKRECTSRREGPEGQGWRVCFRSRSASWMLHGTLGRSGHVICHVSPLLRTLHWFPTSLEVNAKVLARPYKIGLRNHTYRIAMSMYTHTHMHTLPPRRTTSYHDSHHLLLYPPVIPMFPEYTEFLPISGFLFQCPLCIFVFLTRFILLCSSCHL